MKFKDILKSVLTLSAAAVMCMSLSGCGTDDSSSASSSNSSGAASAASNDSESGNYTGSFVITLHPEFAPETCENFEKLVKDKFYDGLTFHRVYPGFMAQGGDPNGNGSGGSENTIKGEFVSNGVNNTLSHVGGIVSMARSEKNDSASSQFFICFSDISAAYTNNLNGNYAAFGQVTEGMNVVDGLEKIEVIDSTGTGQGEVSTPVKPVKIEKAEMIDDDKDGKHRVKFTVSYTVKDENSSADENSESSTETSAQETEESK